VVEVALTTSFIVPLIGHFAGTCFLDSAALKRENNATLRCETKR